jgi:hypothetical protein
MGTLVAASDIELALAAVNDAMPYLSADTLIDDELAAEHDAIA